MGGADRNIIFSKPLPREPIPLIQKVLPLVRPARLRMDNKRGKERLQPPMWPPVHWQLPMLSRTQRWYVTSLQRRQGLRPHLHRRSRSASSIHALTLVVTSSTSSSAGCVITSAMCVRLPCSSSLMCGFPTLQRLSGVPVF